MEPGTWNQELLLERQPLHTPVGDLADVELRLAPAIHLVDRSKLLDQFAGCSELAEDLAVERHLVDLAVVHRRGRIRIGREQVLLRARRDADRRWRTDVDILRLEIPVAVEDLNPIVASVADVDEALRIDRHRVRDIELAWRGAARSPGLDVLAVLVELGDARVAIAVGDVDVAGRIPGDIGRPIEVVAGHAGPLRLGRPTLAATSACGRRCRSAFATTTTT